MKYAYISTISPGYMFAMNATLNANKYYGTNADVHLLYPNSVEKDPVEMAYMKRCETAFPFKVKWIPKDNFGGNYFDSKLKYAATLKDEYDSVCIIDADLFICSDTKEYFEKTAKENMLITATRVRSGMKDKTNMAWDDPEFVDNRQKSYFADFPTFINPKFGEEFLNCWYSGTNKNCRDTSKDSEQAHDYYATLIVMNRCICKLFKPEQTIALDGNFWDADFGLAKTDYIRKDDIMVNENGKRFHAIHNKWWKLGRGKADLKTPLRLKGDVANDKRLARFEKNINAIKDFMVWFNEMTPETKRDDYLKEKISRQKYIEEEPNIMYY